MPNTNINTSDKPQKMTAKNWSKNKKKTALTKPHVVKKKSIA